jgi:nucleotide-binding universal stress UspA family protein
MATGATNRRIVRVVDGSSASNRAVYLGGGDAAMRKVPLAVVSVLDLPMAARGPQGSDADATELPAGQEDEARTTLDDALRTIEASAKEIGRVVMSSFFPWSSPAWSRRPTYCDTKSQTAPAALTIRFDEFLHAQVRPR